MATTEYDLIAIGGGTAGLVTTAGAAFLGAKPALIERASLGGDCLWTGCVPSKALIASARMAHAMRNASELGLTGAAPVIAFSEIMTRMRKARGVVAHHDDPERFRGMGVSVEFGTARFLDHRTVEVEGVGRLRSKRIVIATGAIAALPPIPGLKELGFLTNENVFDQEVLPERVAILGGGPIGLEFAQVFCRLGAKVTVVEMLPRILPAEDPDVSETLTEILRAEGVTVETRTKIVEAKRGEDGSKQLVASDGRVLTVDEVLVAVGRRPCTGSLELEKAGVSLDRAAVQVDASLRTSNRGIWAAGDVTGGLQFTHVAEYMAKTVLRNALFPFSSKVDYSVVPWVTYTDPEVAHVGLGQAEAEARGASTFVYPFNDLDRAITDAQTTGFVKISADKKGRIFGATVVAHGAGELLQPIVLAMKHGLKLSDIANTIFPYPTMAEGVKRTADAFQRTRLEGTGGRILKKVVSWMT